MGQECKFNKTLIREFPLGKFTFQALDKHLENEIGVSRTHENFYKVVLFLYIAQMYLRISLFVK
jgi:hypothetical protein